MLIGGFYSVDGAALSGPALTEDFDLRLDTAKNYDRKVYTNNGRTASVYAMRHCAEQMKGKKVLLPDYLCLSVISAVEAAGIEYDFYRVNRALEIDLEDLKNKLDDTVGMLYVIHYFTIPQPKSVVDEVVKIAEENNLLIMEDITQAIFSRDEERMGFGDYAVGSLRKWFPMTDGGIMAVKNGVSGVEQEMPDGYDLSVYRELMISVIRKEYRLNPSREKETYLQYEKNANAGRYLDLTPRHITDESKKIMLSSDIDKLIKRRVENFNYLYEELKDVKGLEILSKPIDEDNNYVPFGFTVLAEDREGLYRHLVNNNIIPEIQWILPVEYYTPGEDAQFLSDHNIMLQCDQRYGIEEMKYTADKIKEFLNK
ncbi:MAG: DegT/DnrJ/EryC1/StrS aminotransferase family protein [Firmicutes bacterium]|nr:DegT/DnrJ/EryC1/StrS aminotransferase family protein [Bacillota bacterium]